MGLVDHKLHDEVSTGWSTVETAWPYSFLLEGNTEQNIWKMDLTQQKKSEALYLLVNIQLLLHWTLYLSCSRAARVVVVVKNPSANAEDITDVDSIPELGTSPGEGNVNPLQYSCLENSMARGAWWATIRRVTENWTWLRWLECIHTIMFYSRKCILPWLHF